MKILKENLVNLLRWSEKYTETDMVYLAEGGFWINLQKGARLLVSFLIMYAFGNWLSKDLFGTYEYILAIMGVLTVFTLPGMNKALTGAIAQNKDGTFGHILKLKIKYSLIGSAILATVATYYFFQESYELVFSFLIAAFLFPSFKIFPFYSDFWTGRKRFDIRSKYRVASSILSALIIIPVIYYSDSFPLILISIFLTHSIFDFLFLKKSLSRTENRKVDHKSVSLGKTLTFIDAINLFTKNLDNIIIWYFLGAVPVAIYSFGYKPVSKAADFFPFSDLTFPKLSEKNIKNIKKSLLKKVKKSYLLMIPSTAASIIIAPYFYRIVIPQYVDSVPYFQVLALLFLFIPFSIFKNCLIVEMKKRDLYIINVTSSLLRVFLFLALLPFFGLWGIVISLITSKATESILTFHYFLKI